MNVIHHILTHDQRMSERTQICLEIDYRPSRIFVRQMEIDVTILAGDENRRVVGNRSARIVDGLREKSVGNQVRTIGSKIANVSCGNQRARDELRCAAAGHEIGENLVITGLWE